MDTGRLQSIAAELAQRYGWRYTWDAMAHEAMLRVGEAAVYGGALREVMRPVVTGEAIVAVECSRSGHIVIRLQYVPSMCRTDERARELAAWACYAPPTAASYDEYAAGVRTLAGRTGWQVCADDAAQVLTLSRPYATVVTGCELAAALTYHTRGEAIVAVHTAEQQPVIRLAYIPTTKQKSTDEIQEIESRYELPPIEGGTEKQIAYARAIRARSIRNYRHYVYDRCCRKYPDEESRLAELKHTAIAFFEGMTAKQIIDLCCSLDGGRAARKGQYITFSKGQ